MASSTPSVGAISFPQPGTVLQPPAAADFAAALRAWMAVSTDRVLALDALCQTIGPDASPAEHADVAASFLAHQAIGNRVAEIGAAAKLGTATSHAMVVELCHRPVLGDDGSPVAADLADACVLLEAIIGRAELSLDRTARTVHETVRLRSAINADLKVAEQLALRLGDQVRHITELNVRATAVMARVGSNDNPDPDELVRLADDIAKVRASLERADAERQRLISSWSAIPARIERMKAQAEAVRGLRARCEEKVRPLPNLAVPSVTAIDDPLPMGQLELQPWPAVEPRCRAYLAQLDRVQAALDEAQRRYGAPLRERDELRGLVQAFHDKAGEAGLDEHLDLDPVYRVAVTELWSAPCDLVAARELVQRYVGAVNAITNGEIARSAVATTGDPSGGTTGPTGDTTP